jgi:catechol 2,3-dioxygenase-like lactoylglutathione lyase family enzyme
MLLGLAHTAICVPDVEAAVAWYRSALGLTVLSPPYLMEGDAITRDMGELLPSRPVAVKAAILGVGPDDHVLEVIEYPNEPAGGGPPRRVDQAGITHIGLLCDDVAAMRADVVAAGAEPLVGSVASVAGVRTTWIRDPWGVTFILVEKTDPTKPYWHQY